jgi:hypothetical protein
MIDEAGFEGTHVLLYSIHSIPKLTLLYKEGAENFNLQLKFFTSWQANRGHQFLQVG